MRFTQREKRYKSYIKLLKIKYYFKKNIISILKKHRYDVFINSQYTLTKEEMDIKYNEYKMIYNTVEKKYRPKILLKSKIYKTNRIRSISVSFYEYLQVNYNISKQYIISYIENTNNWYYPKLDILKIPFNENLLKNKDNPTYISNKIRNILYSKLNKRYELMITMNNDPVPDWHIDNSYDFYDPNNTNDFIISQSNKKNLGTYYYYIPRVNSNQYKLFKDIHKCCDKLSINYLKRFNKYRKIPEGFLSNITSQCYHKSPSYNSNDVDRSVWLFE